MTSLNQILIKYMKANIYALVARSSKHINVFKVD